MSFEAPALSPTGRPIRSLIATAQRGAPEVGSFPCVDPVETAADKLSALAWRVRARDRTRANDDPTIIRHLHYLAALELGAVGAPHFRELVLAAAAADEGRGGGTAGDPAAMFGEMLNRLETDPLWAREYEDFVREVSFAGLEEGIDFGAALAACARLATVVHGTSETDRTLS
jgi:Nucleotidyl transferase AbiEii toxin, Type IV TA system